MNPDQLDLFAEADDSEPLDPAQTHHTVFAVLDLKTIGLSLRDDKIIEVGHRALRQGNPLGHTERGRSA